MAKHYHQAFLLPVVSSKAHAIIIINDRLDITGARWSLQGAEAVLKLRSLKSSGDFETYWKCHKKISKKKNYDFLEFNNFG